MDVRVLGPMEVASSDGDPTSVTSRSQRIVLAMLAARRGTIVGTDELIEQLWGEEPPPSALSSLRAHISRLRKVVGDQLRSEPSGYVLDASTDVARFSELIDQASDQASPIASDLLNEALDLWRGRPFEDLTDAPALAASATALANLRTDAREQLAEHLVGLSRHSDASALAEEILAENPYRERAWATLVRALSLTGRKVEAMRATQAARTRLADAGLVPGALLQEAEALALTSDDRTTSVGRMVPVPTSSLIGRSGDLDAVAELLDQHRLVTLLGPGGVGKTRLAYETAQAVRGNHQRGAVVAELAGLDQDHLIAEVLVDALGLTPRTTAEEALAGAGDLPALLVIDNCEHLLERLAPLVELLLGSGHELVVLATSRERLGVPGERAYQVEPLPVFGDDAAAVQLFAERATAASAQLGPDAVRDVERIVQRLDGLPLAVEMAAARTAMMGLADLADAIESDLSVLRSDRRHAEDRHRTLRATIEWSERALEESMRSSLHEMAVFAGQTETSDLAAVLTSETATEDVLGLVGCSLATMTTRHGRGRYRLLATIKEHGLQHLSSDDREHEMRRRHAEHFTEAAVEADRALRSESEAEADARFAAIFDELRAAFAWSSDHAVDHAVRLCRAVSEWGRSRQRPEVFEWSSTLLSRRPDDPRMGVVAAWTAHHLADHARLDEAETMAARAIALDESARVRAIAADARSDIGLYRGDLDQVAEQSQQLVALGADLDDSYTISFGWLGWSLAKAYGGHLDEARALLDRIDVGSGAPSIQGWAAYARAEMLAGDDPAAAADSASLAITLADSVNNSFLGGVARVTRASVLATFGAPQEVASGFLSVIAHWQTRNDLVHQVTTLRNVVPFLTMAGSSEAAALLVGALERDSIPPTFGAEAEALASAALQLKTTLGADRYEDLHREGGLRSVDAATNEAIVALSTIGAGR